MNFTKFALTLQRIASAANLKEDMNTKTISAALIVATLFCACTKGSDRPFPDNGGSGGGKTDTEEITVKDGIVASVTYFGDYYGTGFLNYIVLLQYGEMVENADGSRSFKQNGTEVSLNVLSSSKGDATFLPEGTYSLLGEGVYNAAGITPSVKQTDSNGNVNYGDTYLYTQNKDQYWLEPLTSARLTVSGEGTYYLQAVFGVEGYSYSFTYEGPLVITDKSQTEDGPAGDYDFKAGYVLASNMGHAWGDDTDDWIVLLEDEDSSSDLLQVEFVCPTAADSAVFPEGTFTVPAGFTELTEIPAGTLCPFYTQTENGKESYWGTYYQRGNVIWYEAQSGTLKITKSGKGYSFVLDFAASYEGNPHVRCSYSGDVEVDTGSYVNAATLSLVKKLPRKFQSHAQGETSRRLRRGRVDESVLAR